jgi:hypothetical protein
MAAEQACSPFEEQIVYRVIQGCGLEIRQVQTPEGWPVRVCEQGLHMD